MKKCLILAILMMFPTASMATDLNYYPPPYDPTSWSEYDYNAPHVGLREVYGSDISPKQILTAFYDGAYKYAWGLTTDYVKGKISEQLDYETLRKRFLKIAAKKLEEILYKPTTNEQKAKEIFGYINSTFSGYQSSSTGNLNLSFKYSPETGVMRLEWDSIPELDKCWFVNGEVEVCKWDPYWQMKVCWVEFTYGEEWVKMVPEHYVYRIENGQKKLITKIGGEYYRSTDSITLGNKDPWGSVKSIYNFDGGNPFSVGTNRVAFLDFDSDLRGIGKTLAYEVVSSTRKWRDDTCNDTVTRSTSSFVDSNGDGLVDFVPISEYSKLTAKWFTPILVHSISN